MAERTNASGSVTSTDLYGKIVTGNPGGDPNGYGAQAGYYTDAETGLLLLTHRFYDPQQGRFLTRDPMGYGGGINLYSYVRNNAGNDWDPDGTQGVLTVPEMGAGAALLAYLYWLATHHGVPPPISFPPINIPNPWQQLPPVVAVPPARPTAAPITQPVNSPRDFGLPTGGDYPFVPKRKWKPGRGLETAPGSHNQAPIDKNGDVWEPGKNHNFPNESCEWDVQQKNGKHVNVGGDSGTAKYPVKGNK